MKVYLLKDITNLGFEGEIVKVSDGYAKNYLIPRKLALEITSANQSHYEQKKKIVAHKQEVLATETSMLAERIKSTKVTIKKKAHENGTGPQKLYGSVSAGDIVDALAEENIRVAKNQVDFGKSIKTTGTFEVTIKLSSRLQPKTTVVVVPTREE